MGEHEIQGKMNNENEDDIYLISRHFQKSFCVPFEAYFPTTSEKVSIN
jgi:hypothetical protein